MGPMMWITFLYIMLILTVIFVAMAHESELKKVELENEKKEKNLLSKWW